MDGYTQIYLIGLTLLLFLLSSSLLFLFVCILVGLSAGRFPRARLPCSTTCLWLSSIRIGVRIRVDLQQSEAWRRGGHWDHCWWHPEPANGTTNTWSCILVRDSSVQCCWSLRPTQRNIDISLHVLICNTVYFKLKSSYNIFFYYSDVFIIICHIGYSKLLQYCIIYNYANKAILNLKYIIIAFKNQCNVHTEDNSLRTIYEPVNIIHSNTHNHL